MKINSELVSRIVRENIESLCRSFFPNGKKVGSEWQLGNVAGDPGQSLRVSLNNDKPGLFYDHSTGDKGDFIDLLEQSKGIAYPAAAMEIGRALGIDVEEHPQQNGQFDWLDCVRALEAKPDMMREIATWRGFSPEFCQWLIGRKSIGLYCAGIAFPVHGPGGKVLGAHYLRDRPNKKWAYLKGTPATPLLISDLGEPEVHVFESTWDGLAFYDRVEAYRSTGACVIVTRGAGNTKLLKGLIPAGKRVYVWPQNDKPDLRTRKVPSEEWFQGIRQNLEGSFWRVQTPDKYDDLNDWTRDGATKADLVDAISAAANVEPTSEIRQDISETPLRCCPDLDWEPLDKYPDSQRGLVKYDSIYESDNSRFWILDREGKWIPVPEAAVKRKLNQEFFLSKKADQETGAPAETEIELRSITEARNVAFACSLAGYRRGVYQIPSGERILVTEDPKPVMPSAGEWSKIEEFLSQLLGELQLTYFIGWLSIAVCSLHGNTFTPGQALILAGPADCGKTFLQSEIITPILGGRIARPYQHMTGQTPFNADLFLAEHQMVSDEVPRTDLASRRAFGTFLKDITGNPDQRLHAKHKNARVLRPFWRLTVSLNDEPENLAMLPVIEESIVDKLILFKTARPTCLPIDESARKPFLDAIHKELPAFVYYLMNYKIPEQIRGGRFGITYFINPDLDAELAGLSPESQLLDLVDAALFTRWENETEGTATEIYTRLINSDHRSAAMQLLKGGGKTTGTYLKRLARVKNPRVFVHMRGNVSRYQIFNGNEVG